MKTQCQVISVCYVLYIPSPVGMHVEPVIFLSKPQASKKYTIGRCENVFAARKFIRKFTGQNEVMVAA